MSNWWAVTATRGLDERQQPSTDGAEGFAIEAENLSFSQAGVLVMRLGMKAQSLTDSGITGKVEWVGKHVTNDGVEELWAASNNAGTANLARRSGGTWTTVSFSDTVNVSNLRYMQGVSLNGKFFLAYDSNVNRLHVWDGSALRRAGIGKPSAPTVADTGAGAYGANARRYRVQFLIISGSDTVAASELSDATNTFTPSGAGTAARVTKPTTPDSATHWRVFAISGSTDTYDSYKLISSNIAVGTTTYDDSTNPASYSGDAPAALGTFIPPPSAKFLAADDAHLFMAGAWESSAATGETEIKQNRIWFTPAIGATDIGDEERIPNTDDQWNKVDCGDAGPITGIEGPLDGRMYNFKAGSVGVLAPTNDPEAPYIYKLLTPSAGAIHQRCILLAENGEGVPCLYFASRTGVYQLVSGAIRDISEPIRRDLRLTNFSAANSFLGWDPIEKTLVAQTNATVVTKQGQYAQFAYDVASDRWTGLQFGAIGTGWILGRSLLGFDTVCSTGSAEIHGCVTALDSSGVPRLQLGGCTSSEAGVIYAYAAQAGRDGSTAFTAKTRFRVPLGVSKGRMIRLGPPTFLYVNPIGSESVTATFGVSYVGDTGETRSGTMTLAATAADNPIGMKRGTIESLSLTDTYAADVVMSLSYSGSFTATVPPAVHTVMVPWAFQEELPR